MAKVIHEWPRCQRNDRCHLPETRDGTVMGTAGYMSSEQVRGELADHRSDIFAFGAIFYEMLTGRRAFHHNSAIETMNAILHAKPPALPARLPPAVTHIVWRCLERDANRRYQSVDAVIADLNRVANRMRLTRSEG